MITTPREYIDAAPEQGKIWLGIFFQYMEQHHPKLKVNMFRQCPMYKFKESNLDGYVMFTANKHHFSVHTLDFNLIEGMKALLPRAQYGKGCVKVKYSDRDAIPFLQTLCDNSIDKYNKANRL